MFEELMVPSPKNIDELRRIQGFIHPDHLIVEIAKLDSDYSNWYFETQGWDEEDAAIFKATKFLYLNGVDPAKNRQVIQQILEKIQYKEYGETDIHKFRIIGKRDQKELVQIVLNKDLFEVFDTLGFSYAAECNPDKPNNSTMTAEAILLTGSSRSPYLPRLRNLIGLSLSYFKKNDIWISQFDAEWNSPKGNYPSTNHTQYKELVGRGMVPKEAAFLTPTGKVLKRFGFNNVEVPESDKYGTVAPIFTR